jgi:AcrR family transcriptional regulator/DNA-binding MarR family transcriptional regulator
MSATAAGTLLPPSPNGSRPGGLSATAAQRARIVNAAIDVAGESGSEPVSLAAILAAAHVSRGTFYALFEDRECAVLAAIDHAAAQARRALRAVHDPHAEWAEQIRGGLHALLEMCDQQPALARLLVVHTQTAGPRALARRARLQEQLAKILQEGRRGSRLRPPPLTGEALVGGVLAVIQTRLARPAPPRLTGLLNPLMSFIMEPYRGARLARMQMNMKPPPKPLAPPDATAEPGLLDGLPMRLTYRTMRVLAVLAAEPGLSNLDVSAHAGVSDQGQISKLLKRLAGLGLIENRGKGQPRGAPNSWWLTPSGAKVERAMHPELTATNGRAQR